MTILLRIQQAAIRVVVVICQVIVAIAIVCGVFYCVHLVSEWSGVRPKLYTTMPTFHSIPRVESPQEKRDTADRLLKAEHARFAEMMSNLKWKRGRYEIGAVIAHELHRSRLVIYGHVDSVSTKEKLMYNIDKLQLKCDWTLDVNVISSDEPE